MEWLDFQKFCYKYLKFTAEWKKSQFLNEKNVYTTKKSPQKLRGFSDKSTVFSL